MGKRLRRLVSVTLVLCVAAFAALAAPKIEVDTADYDAGIIKEGTSDKLSHTFVIRNTGDEPLRIKEVKPG